MYGFMQVLVSQLLPFVVRTILIYKFGVDYLGLNSLFKSILSVLSLMELGFGTAVVYSMYRPVADGDADQICAYLSYYRRIYHFVGVAILCIGVLLMPFLRFLVMDPVLPGNLNLYVCYLVFLSESVISYLLFGYMTAVPTAYQRRDILSRVGMVSDVLACVMKSVILLCSDSFYIYLISIPVITVVRNLMIAITVRKRYPDIRCRGGISNEQKQDLNKRVYGLMVNKLTNVSRNSIDSVCISAFIGLAATGIYNNYFFVLSAVMGICSVIYNSMMASVGNSIAKESPEKNYKDMRLFDFLFMGIVGWATVCMVCLYQPFISIWVGNDMMLGTPIVIVMGIYFYIMETGAIRWIYHEGAGLWYECRFIMIGEAVANVLLNVVLCRFIGVLGIVLATVISVFVTNCILCPELLFRLYFKNGKLKEYWWDHVGYTVTMVVSVEVSWIICEILIPMEMIEGRNVWRCVGCLGGRLAVGTVVAGVVFWLMWHRSKRYKLAIGWGMRRGIK